MKNWKTSARTAAQQSSKSPLLFRPAALAAILMLVAVLLSSCNEDRKYTVEFIKDGDTSYLMNSVPLTMSEAKDVAKGFKNGKATPVLFYEIWKPQKNQSSTIVIDSVSGNNITVIQNGGDSNYVEINGKVYRGDSARKNGY